MRKLIIKLFPAKHLIVTEKNCQLIVLTLFRTREGWKAICDFAQMFGALVHIEGDYQY